MSKDPDIVPVKRGKRTSILAPTDYSNFGGTDDVRILLRDRGASEETNITLSHIRTEEGGRIDSLLSNLRKLGFRRFAKVLHSGFHSLILEVDKHQMIRITSDSCNDPKPDSPDILKPLVTYHFEKNGYRIDVLPRVHTLAEITSNDALAKEFGLTNPHEEVQQFIRRLLVENWRRDRILWDCSYDNIALIRVEGGPVVPIILDHGAVRKSNEVDTRMRFKFVSHYGSIEQKYNAERLISYVAERGERGSGVTLLPDYFDRESSRFSEKPLPYAEVQAAYVERRGLEYDKVAGVLDKNALENVIRTWAEETKSYPQTPLLMEAALADRSPAECEQAIEIAKAKHKEGEKFCDIVRRELRLPYSQR